MWSEPCRRRPSDSGCSVYKTMGPAPCLGLEHPSLQTSPLRLSVLRVLFSPLLSGVSVLHGRVRSLKNQMDGGAWAAQLLERPALRLVSGHDFPVSWVQVPHWALCWQHGACLGFSLSLSLSLSLCPSPAHNVYVSLKINKRKQI